MVFAGPLLSKLSSVRNTSEKESEASNGQAWRELLVITAVPVIANVLLSAKLRRQVWRSMKKLVVHEDAKYVYRTIENRRVYTEYRDMEDASNKYTRLLQEAVMKKVVELADLEDRDMLLELMERPLQELEKLDPAHKAKKRDDDDDDDYYRPMSSWYDDANKSMLSAEAMKRLDVGQTPKQNQWTQVQPGIDIRIDVETAGTDDEDNTIVEGLTIVTTTLTLRSNLANGQQLIDQFVHNAFDEYQRAELTKTTADKSRYMYVQISNTANSKQSDSDGDAKDNQSDSSSERNTIDYQRFALGAEKTFKNIFFEEKEQLLRLVDQFQTRTGKFAVKGFPYKLGLLLHGPPGTGKTSIIKALAHHTNRHIVTVSLSKIETNQQLMNEMFDLRFRVRGMDLPVRMEFEDVIFVMEDVDCASKIVNKRVDSVSKSEKDGAIRSTKKQGDALTLDGLLNVLDGVIDCPGRIVVMTTNHPDKLDPALVRPGRINKKLFLATMNSKQMGLMVEYYFQTTLSDAQRARLESLAPELTPAEVEELCAENVTVDDFLTSMERGHRE